MGLKEFFQSQARIKELKGENAWFERRAVRNLKSGKTDMSGLLILPPVFAIGIGIGYAGLYYDLEANLIIGLSIAGLILSYTFIRFLYMPGWIALFIIVPWYIYTEHFTHKFVREKDPNVSSIYESPYFHQDIWNMFYECKLAQSLDGRFRTKVLYEDIHRFQNNALRLSGSETGKLYSTLDYDKLNYKYKTYPEVRKIKVDMCMEKVLPIVREWNQLVLKRERQL